MRARVLRLHPPARGFPHPPPTDTPARAQGLLIDDLHTVHATGVPPEGLPILITVQLEPHSSMVPNLCQVIEKLDRWWRV